MNKVLAVFRKEYLETRTFTLVFWLVGVLFPALGALQTRYEDFGVFSNLLVNDPVTLGGILAVWLNATFLFATSFARERENGTFQTLRRVASDWRVAALGKFAAVVASTLALAAFFLVESIVVAKLSDQKPFEEFCRALESSSEDLTVVGTIYIGIAAWCWGIFWTGRTSRQMSAIFRATLCPLLIGVGAETCFSTVIQDHAIQKSVLATLVGATGLLVLVAAPFKGRFGYRESEVKTEAETRAARSEGSWSQIDVDKKPAAFKTLVAHVYAEASLMFRSSASVMFELAILIAICAGMLFATSYNNDFYKPTKTLVAFYCLCFASGLFVDSKRDASVVRNRLSVRPGAYWSANAFAELLVCVVAYALILPHFLNSVRFMYWVDRTLIYRIEASAFVLLLFGVSLWGAALKGSRIVVWSVTLVMLLTNTFSLNGIAKLWQDNRPLKIEENDGSLETFCVYALAGLVFTVASYAIGVGRARRRKTTWGVAIPLGATVVCLLLAFAGQIPRLPGAYKVRKIDAASFPQTQREYDLLVDAERNKAEKTKEPPLFKTSDGTDAVAVELNDLRERFVDACELTKKRAASFVDVENAEAAFYAALRKALDDPARPAPEQVEPNALAQFLSDVPATRPTSEQLADNAYVFAQFGDLDLGVKTPQALGVVASARSRNDKVWKRALWNAVQVMPARIDYPLNSIDGGYAGFAEYSSIPTTYGATRDLERFNTIVEALDPTTQAARNEINRRLLSLRLAATTPRPDEPDRAWESISAIYLRGLLAETPKTPMDPKIPPAIAKRRPPELFQPCPDPEKNLVPFLDEDGNVVTSPDCQSVVQALKLAESSPENDVADLQKRFVDLSLDSDFSLETQEPAPRPENASKKAFFNPDAPLRLTASVPRYKNDLSDDEIGSLEIPGVYPAYAVDGSPLEYANRRFYAVTYNDVDREGDPIIFVPEPCGEAPEFDCGDAKPLTSRDAATSDEPVVSRVRAIYAFRPDGENSFVVPDLWAIRSTSESNGEKSARVKYLDATGVEPLDKNGAPRYAEKKGLFLDEPRMDYREYPYAFSLNLFQNSLYRRLSLYGYASFDPERSNVVRATESGEFVELSPDDVLVEGDVVYAKFPVAAFLASSAWCVNPSLDWGTSDSAILIVEPLEPTTFAPVKITEE
ncbi:MAG: hypothetical protein IK077_09700 [Thermoguttaceae bacterium]|nr:hypothetical protein [Thermoguttaceae bacterium]